MIKLSNLRLVFNGEYESLYDEWCKQNAEIDKLTAEKNRKQRIIDGLKEEDAEKTRALNKFVETIEKYKTDLQEKEKQRHKTAAKLGGYQKEINKLKEQIEFLKNNKRAPNLEELKDYTLRRKRRNKK